MMDANGCQWIYDGLWEVMHWDLEYSTGIIEVPSIDKIL